MKRKPKIEFYQDKAGKHRWRIVATNGQTIAASSQGYVTLTDCKHNLQRIAQLIEDNPGQIIVWSRWKENDTGEVPEGAVHCQVRYRDGTVSIGDARSFVWSLSFADEPSPYDIVEYRVPT